MRMFPFLITVTTTAAGPVMGDAPGIPYPTKEMAGVCEAHGTAIIEQS